MTLRLLDVKYFVLLPESDVVGGGRDYHQWTSVLHATSALRAYHHVTRGEITPWGIAEFLILNRTFPRSVVFACRGARRMLDDIAAEYGERLACQDVADRLTRRLEAMDIRSLFQSGLHEFVSGTIEEVHLLSRDVSKAYHF
jgi:uncharacterized alpha-E superfamily protein